MYITCTNCRFRDGSERCSDCYPVQPNWQERTEAQKMMDGIEPGSKLLGSLTSGYIYMNPIEKSNSINDTLNNAFGPSLKKEKEDNNMKTKVDYDQMYAKKTQKQKAMSKIKKVVFNNPATIVLWSDGTKTIVRSENESFDPEKGLAMAIAKKHFGNEGYYYDIFKKWIPNGKDTVAESDFKDIKPKTNAIPLKEFCVRNNITKNKAYGMIKRKEINAFKNEAGMWMVEVPIEFQTNCYDE